MAAFWLVVLMVVVAIWTFGLGGLEVVWCLAACFCRRFVVYWSVSCLAVCVVWVCVLHGCVCGIASLALGGFWLFLVVFGGWCFWWFWVFGWL